MSKKQDLKQRLYSVKKDKWAQCEILRILTAAVIELIPDSKNKDFDDLVMPDPIPPLNSSWQQL